MPPENKPRPLNEVELHTEEMNGLNVKKRTVKLKGPDNVVDLLRMASEKLETD